MQKVFKINLDISKKVITPTFEVNTNDLNSIKLLITITDEHKPLDLTGITPRLPVRKPDNHVVFQDCEVVDAENGQIEVILENQAYVVAGTHTAEVMCYKENALVSVTGTFSYKAKKGIMSDDALESKSEFTAITKTLNDVQETIEDMRKNGTGIDTEARKDIEDVTAQLADTVKKGQVTVTDIDKTKGKIDQTFLTPELLQQIAGTTPINTVPAYGSLVPEQFAFPVLKGVAGKNMFNKDTVLSNTSINGSGVNAGKTYTLEGWVTSDWIRVNPNTAYYKNAWNSAFFYDSSKNFLAFSTGGVKAITTPENCYWVRLTIAPTDTVKINTAQFEKGTVGTSYEPYQVKFDSNVIEEKTITKNMLAFSPLIGEQKNLFNKDKVTTGYYVDNANGELKASEDLTSSEFIAIEPNTNYYKNTYHMGAWYNSNKVFVSGFTNGSRALTSPPESKYVRYTVIKTDLDIAQLEKGTSETEYEPAKPMIDASYVKNLNKMNEEIKPLNLKTTLKELSPTFFVNYKLQEKDIAVVSPGESINTVNKYNTERTDAKNRPPLMTEFAYPTFIEEQLRWDGQKYYRYDTGIFTETATEKSTKEYDLAWDWVYTTEDQLPNINNRPALTRILNGVNVSVSYKVPSDVKRCDFIYRTDYLNAPNATVTVSGGNGILQVYNETTQAWVETNGFTYSAKEEDRLISGSSGNLRKSIYQKRLKMRVVGTIDNTTVTITNNGQGRLTYWGIQTGMRPVMSDFILASRGGHWIARLANFEEWDIDYWKPDLILWQIPIINQNLDVGDATFKGKNMGNRTNSFYANEILTKANQFKNKAYKPELISFIMFFGKGNNAINANDEWVYGYTDSTERVSVPSYLSKTNAVLTANGFKVLDMFSLFLEYSKRKATAEEKNIIDTVLNGSGKMGSTLTIDGTHLNDKGAKVVNQMFDNFFIQ